MDVSLVLACYREEEHLESSFSRIVRALSLTGLRYEIILVDDKSPDRTREIIEEIVRAHPEIPLVTLFHETNTGRGGAVKDGLLQARGAVVGYIDADLEIDVAYLPLGIEPILRGEDDVVIGKRFYRKYPFHRFLLSRGYNLLMRGMLALPYRDTEAGFKFFRREKIFPILTAVKNQGWFFDTEIVARAHEQGLQIREVPVYYEQNAGKTSTVRPIKDSLRYLRDLWNFKKSR